MLNCTDISRPFLPETLASCFALFLTSVFYEFFKQQRSRHFVQNFSVLRYTLQSANGVGQTYSSMDNTPGNLVLPQAITLNSSRRRLSWPHLVQTVLHLLQITVGYLLMLVFMTFNVYLCLSVVVGSALGYFMFGPRDAGSGQDFAAQSEHCH